METNAFNEFKVIYYIICNIFLLKFQGLVTRQVFGLLGYYYMVARYIYQHICDIKIKNAVETW